jgi:hypothetical protein
MDNNFLHQAASFIKLAIEVNEDLQDRLLNQIKAATVQELNKEKYKMALNKVADVLYDSDFLSGEHEKRSFVKKAMEDPIYIIRTLEKVCAASDVAQIGKPARIAARPKTAESYDPVMEAAFGYSARTLVDE